MNVRRVYTFEESKKKKKKPYNLEIACSMHYIKSAPNNLPTVLEKVANLNQNLL
jgi:hypothetical protein